MSPGGRDEQVLLPHRPVGRRMCIGGGPRRAHRVQVFPHELEGHGGPCFSAGPLPLSIPLPIHVRTVPQIRELAAEMVGGADEEKGAVCAGNDLWGCSSRHWVSSHAGSVQAYHVWGSRTGSGLS